MNVDQTISTYVSELQPLYKLFSSKVQDLIYSILKAHNIASPSVTCREKSPTSLKEKILHEGRAYEDPLHQITDLSGVRIITYFPSDVDKILPILESEFSVDRASSVDKRKTVDPSIFGYASVHLVVELAEARCQLPEYAVFRGLKCEIQVRTILQHAWAEIEHNIIYKSSDEMPFELRRKFASLAGLLEVADREFEQLRREEVKVREKIKKTIKRENLELPINLDSINFYLKAYHKEEARRSLRTGRFVKMLNALKIESLQQLHNILTTEALDRADVEVARIRNACPRTRTARCLLRYFVAVANNAKLPREKTAEFSHCPMLKDPESYKKRRLQRSRSAKTERGTFLIKKRQLDESMSQHSKRA